MLQLVNKVSSEQTKRFDGLVKDVLVEEINHQDNSLVTGKTDENVTVHFKGSGELVGEIVKVKLNECRGFYYLGERN